jgi:hypothetical protein
LVFGLAIDNIRNTSKSRKVFLMPFMEKTVLMIKRNIHHIEYSLDSGICVTLCPYKMTFKAEWMDSSSFIFVGTRVCDGCAHSVNNSFGMKTVVCSHPKGVSND